MKTSEDSPNMTWNHRIIKTINNINEFRWGIHEVYYKDGIPDSYTKDPIDLVIYSELGGPETDASAIHSLKWQLEMIQKCFSKPVLTEKDFVKGE